MPYEIEWVPAALRELRKLDEQVARRVVRAVTALAIDPRPRGVPALCGEPIGTMRRRAGDCRVVYVIDDRQVQVLVVHVAHRGEVHRRRWSLGHGGRQPRPSRRHGVAARVLDAMRSSRLDRHGADVSVARAGALR